MEILFMVFMVVVSLMALFAVVVVLRDVVGEIISHNREKRSAEDERVVRYAERIIADAEARELDDLDDIEDADDLDNIDEPEAQAEPVAEPVAEPAAEEVDDGTISFSTGQQKTLDEKYLELPMEQRGWYDEIIKYASAVEGSKRFKNARYEEYKVGKSRIVRLTIKRGIINCEFILHNTDFKNYVNENKISVKQSATTMLVEAAETVDAVKNSIDIVVAAQAAEKEYKKQLARQRRKEAREAAAASSEASESTDN